MIVFVSPPKWRLPCSDADSLGALMVLKAANAQFEIRHVASENAKPFGEALPSVVVNGTRFCTLRGVLRFLKTTVSFKEEPDARGVLEDLRNLRRGTCDIVDVSDSKYAHDSEDAVSDLDKYVDSLLTRATQVIKRCGSVWRHFILAEILFLVARPVECKVTSKLYRYPDLRDATEAEISVAQCMADSTLVEGTVLPFPEKQQPQELHQDIQHLMHPAPSTSLSSVAAMCLFGVALLSVVATTVASDARMVRRARDIASKIVSQTKQMQADQRRMRRGPSTKSVVHERAVL